MSLEIALALGILGVLVVLGACEELLAVRRIGRDDGRLRLREVALAHDLALPPAGTEAAMHAQALAIRRCVACRQQELCDEFAPARDWTALRAICPNTTYIDGLRRR